MSATTVVTDEAIITSEDTAAGAPWSDFSWGAALAGAVIAVATAFFLLTLGSGVGLALTTTPKLLHGQTPTFLTLGAVYFFAALAFSFAAGAHIAGRLIGPVLETRKEEEFRAAAHGLGVWAIAVVATATMMAIGVFVAEGTAPAMMGKSGDGMTPLATGYWVDTLFRTGNQQQASLDGVRYAQNAPTTGSDAAPAASDQAPPSPAQPQTDDEAQGTTSGATVTPQNSGAPPRDIQIPGTTPSGAQPTQPAATTNDAGTGMPAPGRNIMADKAEAGRILEVDMAKPGDMPADDRVQLAQLVSLDTGMSYAAAQRRVDDVAARIRTDAIKTAETARKVASYASLWAALALLFGAIVSIMSAIAARHEDDRIRVYGD